MIAATNNAPIAPPPKVAIGPIHFVGTRERSNKAAGKANNNIPKMHSRNAKTPSIRNTTAISEKVSVSRSSTMKINSRTPVVPKVPIRLLKSAVSAAADGR